MIISNKIASHFQAGFVRGNSYPQIGQVLLRTSISIAQDGHSFFFMQTNLHKEIYFLILALIFTKITIFNL